MTDAMHRKAECTDGTENVFHDLGLDFAEEELSKARLALRIHDRVQALGLNVTKAAARLGIPQPKASRLLRGYADGFSTEKLLTFLTKLGQDVCIVVSDARGGSGSGKFVLTMLQASRGSAASPPRRKAATRRRA
jgi:predicted XRE-type DNA-binding protein